LSRSCLFIKIYEEKSVIFKSIKLEYILRYKVNMEIKVVLEKQGEGGYTIYVPSLPGCTSQGETKEEALENIKEALELFLEADLDETIVLEGEIAKVIV
jgi:predicted RNase H-like HicB family nuclease